MRFWCSAMPSALLQAEAAGGDEALAELIVVYILAAWFLAGSVAVGVWLYRDVRRRGQSTAGWTAAWAAGPVVGLLVMVAGVRAGRPLGAGLALLTWIVVTGLAVGLLWHVLRSGTVLYDAQGQPVHPRAVARPDVRFVPGEPPPSATVPSAPAPAWRPLGAYGPAPGASIQPAAPPPAPATMEGGSRSVRCPVCHKVFGYVPGAWGPTPVRCPGCGTTGTI